MKLQLLFLGILIFSFANFSIASQGGWTTLQKMLEESRIEEEAKLQKQAERSRREATLQKMLEESRIEEEEKAKRQKQVERSRREKEKTTLQKLLEESRIEEEKAALQKQGYYSEFFQGEFYDININQILVPMQQVNQCGKNSFIYSRTMAEWYEGLLQRNGFKEFHNLVSGGEVQRKIKKLIGGKTCQIHRNILKELNGGKDSNPVEKTGIYLTIWDEDNLYEFNDETKKVGFGQFYKAFFSPAVIQPAKERIMKGRPEVFVIKEFKTAHWIAAIIFKKKKTRSKKERFEVVFIDPIASENKKIKNYKYLFDRMIELLT